LNKLKLTTLTAELPGALELFAKGELTSLTDSLLRGGDITLQAETKDLKFISTLAEGIEIPYGTRLEGKFTMAGPKMGTDLLLMQPEAHAVAVADTIPITVYNKYGGRKSQNLPPPLSDGWTGCTKNRLA